MIVLVKARQQNARSRRNDEPFKQYAHDLVTGATQPPLSLQTLQGLGTRRRASMRGNISHSKTQTNKIIAVATNRAVREARGTL